VFMLRSAVVCGRGNLTPAVLVPLLCSFGIHAILLAATERRGEEYCQLQYMVGVPLSALTFAWAAAVCHTVPRLCSK
jgi:hypothetical protein